MEGPNSLVAKQITCKFDPACKSVCRYAVSFVGAHDQVVNLEMNLRLLCRCRDYVRQCTSSKIRRRSGMMLCRKMAGTPAQCSSHASLSSEPQWLYARYASWRHGASG